MIKEYMLYCKAPLNIRTDSSILQKTYSYYKKRRKEGMKEGRRLHLLKINWGLIQHTKKYII
jgi:hypothetical protein